MKETIDLSTNENPLGPSPRVVEAIEREASRLHRYPPRDDTRLRERLASHHQRGLTPEHFFASSSASTILDLIARATLEPGDEIVICSPTFVVYRIVAENYRARVVDVPLDPESCGHDLDRIVAAIGSRTKVIFVCNPGNPTGVAMPAGEFEHLLSKIPERIVVVADEVYYQYVEDRSFPDTIGYLADRSNIVIVHSFSKGYGMAGLRLGYGIARPELARTLGRHRLIYDLSSIALAAGVAAIGDQEHVARTLSLARTAKNEWYRAFDRLGIRYWPSSTNFVMIAPASPDQALVRLEQDGILVRPVEGPGKTPCLRISVGLEETNARVVAALEQR